jgi:transposase-like protein
MLSEHRDEDAATAFFKQAINNNGFPAENQGNGAIAK